MINNNYGRLQGLILLNIPTGTRKNLRSLYNLGTCAQQGSPVVLQGVRLLGGGKAFNPGTSISGCQPKRQSAARRIKSMKNLYDPIRN